MAAARAWLPPGQLMFGSDFPVLPLALTANALDRYDLPDSERAGLNRGNALKLFPRFA
jgi:predicted TIM-barrel fold metal-dependent hydrolase